MKKYILFGLSLIIPSFLYSQGLDGPGGTEVWPGTNIYYGTASERTDADGNKTWDYHSMTNWDSSPYIDYVYNYWSFSLPVNFRLIYPNNWTANSQEKYPIAIFFHGAGEGGIEWRGWEPDDIQYFNNDHQLVHGGKRWRDWVQDGDFNGFALKVQYLSSWGNFMPRIIEMLDILFENANVDPNRVYIHGLSGGGTAVFEMLENYPQYIAAATPFSGRGSSSDADNNKWKHIPIWIFQGGRDRNPTPFTTNQVLSSVSNVKNQNFFETNTLNPDHNDQYDPPVPYESRSVYTLFPNTGHGTWNPAWGQDKYLDWLLAQDKRNPHLFSDQTEFCDGEVFSVTMGITPGYTDYEWRVERFNNPGVYSTISDNDEFDLSGSKNELTINGDGSGSGYGSYSVRFSRNGDWTDWSKPVDITVKPSTPPASIIASGSTTLPALDGNTSVILSTENSNYSSYRWFRNGAQIQNGATNEITVSTSGQYQLRVTEANQGCESVLSNPIYISVNGVTSLSTPSNVSAVTQSERSIEITWNDVSNEVGYEVYLATNSGGPYSLIARPTANTSSFLSDGLIPNTTYFYRVRAFDNDGGSNYSPVVSDQTISDTQLPEAPENLTLNSRTATSVSLSWQPALDNVAIKHYLVYAYLNGSELGASPQITTATNYTYTNLQVDNRYNFKVKAVDLVDQESPFSNQVTTVTTSQGVNYKYYTFSHGMSSVNEIDDNPGLFTLEGPNPGLTSNFNIDAYSNYDQSKFTYDFYGFIDIEVDGDYTFYTRSDDGSALYLDFDQDGQVNNYTMIVDNDGTHGCQREEGTITLSKGVYPIRVLFFENGGGECLEVSYTGPGFDEILIPDLLLYNSPSQGVIDPPQPPEVPTGLSVATNSYDKLDLAWVDESNNETGFEIYRSETVGGNYKIVESTNANITTFTDDGLTPSKTYHYKIRAIGSDGESEFSTISNGTTAPPPPVPAAPFNLQSSVVSHVQIDLQWSHNITTGTGAPDKFVIERSKSNNSNFAEIDSVEASLFTYSDDNLDPSTQYYYRVRAKNFGGKSGYSNQSNETTNAPPQAPQPASNLTLDVVSFSEIELTWNHATTNPGSFDDPSHFIIERSLNGTDFIEVIQVEASDLSYTDVGLNSNTLYYYQVKATNAGGTATATTAKSATTLKDLPAAPSNLIATDNGGSITLDWIRNSANEDGFVVERQIIANENVTWEEIGSTGPNVTTFDDLSPNTGINFYRVKATNQDGDSDYSNIARSALSDFSILVNFTNTKNDDKVGSPWNNITVVDENTVNFTNPLVNDSGDDSGVNFNIFSESSFGDGFQSSDGTNHLDGYPYWAQKTGAWFKNIVVTLRFTGLDLNKYYKFVIYANEGVANREGLYSINGTTYNINAFQNGALYEFDNIIPDVNGNVDLIMDDLTTESDVAVINLIDIQAFTPEEKTYYPVSVSTDIGQLNGWEDSQGLNPVSFNLANQTYVVNQNMSLDNNLSIPGPNSNLIIAENVHLNVNANLSAGVVLEDNSELTINTSTNPSIVSAATSSTVNVATETTIPKATYGNLHLNGTVSNKTFASDTTIVLGNLVIGDQTGVVGADNNGSTVVINGDLLLEGSNITVGQSDQGKRINLVFNGGGLHKLAPHENDLYFASIRTEGEGTTLSIDSVEINTPIKVAVGDDNGSGLIIEDQSFLELNNHTLEIVGQGTINQNLENGEIMVNNGSINFNTSASVASNLYFPNSNNNLTSLNLLSGQGNGEVVFQSEAEIADIVQVDAGVLNANGNVTLVSTENETAKLGRVGDGATIKGEFNIQRNITRTKGSYFLLGSSIKGNTLRTLMDDISVQGIPGGPFASGWDNIYLYDEPSNSWATISSVDELLPNGVGIATLIFDSNFTGSNRVDLDQTGELVIGDGGDDTMTPGETYDFSLTNDSEGWNLLANPYPSDIDWNAPQGWSRNDVGAVYIYDGQNYTYRTRAINNPLDDGDFTGVIAPGQGFFVKAEGPNPTVSITEDVKTTADAAIFRESAPVNQFKISVIDKNGRNDNTYITFNEENSKDYEIGYDAIKLKGSNINVATFNEDSLALAINAMPEFTGTYFIPLNISGVRNKNISIKFEQIAAFEGLKNIFLHDHLLNKKIDVIAKPNISFAFADEESYKDRFVLEFESFNPRFYTFSGNVEAYNNIPLPVFDIAIDGDTSQIATPDGNGKFEVRLKEHGMYDIIPEAGNSFIQKGLSVSDVVRLKYHINNKQVLFEGENLVAGDVDGSESLTNADIDDLMKVISGSSNQFAGGKSWYFVPKALELDNNPFPLQDRINIIAKDNTSNLDFTAIKIGELDGLINPIFAKKELAINAVHLKARKGSLVSVPIQVAGFTNIEALQLALNWDSSVLKFAGVSTANNQKVYFNEESVAQGMLNLAWLAENESLSLKDDTRFLMLQFYINDEASLNESTIELDINHHSLAVNDDLQMMPILFDNIKIDILDANSSLFAVQNIYPNPAQDHFTIEFESYQEGDVQLKLMTIEGKVVYNQFYYNPAGFNTIDVEDVQLNTGQYIYQLIMNEEVKVGKLIIE